MPTYDFNAMRLAQKKFNPRMTHLGTMELHVDRLVPGGKETLVLGLRKFNLPNGRRVNVESVNYINGVINYPGKVLPWEKIACTFVDYLNGGQRSVLHKLHSYIYDEATGLAALPSDVKFDGHAIFFQQNQVVNLSYMLYGLWPLNAPSPPDVDYAGGGIATMDIEFSVDFCILEEDGNQGGGFGTEGSVRAAQSAFGNVGI